MSRAADFEAASRSIALLCHADLPPDGFRSEILREIAKVISVDAVWWAAADPATLLFTSAYQAGLPTDSASYFIDNEFLVQDVNRWTDLGRDRRGVRSLAEATAGRLRASPRYRDIFAPLGLGDELRTVLRIQGQTWGLLCLHRAAGSNYTSEQADWLRKIAPDLATALRVAVLHEAASAGGERAPGIVMLGPDGSITSASRTGAEWLDELAAGRSGVRPIPVAVQAVAARLRSLGTDGHLPPRLRLRTPAGRWAVLHASWIDGPDQAVIAVIIEEAAPTEVAPVIMLAYGLTPQERKITGLISRGLSTSEVAEELSIVSDTVQDHLKSVFAKTGTGSRAELVATLMRQQYLPRVKARARVGPAGFFA